MTKLELAEMIKMGLLNCNDIGHVAINPENETVIVGCLFGGNEYYKDFDSFIEMYSYMLPNDIQEIR